MDNLDVIRATPKVALTTIEDIDAIGHELSEEHLYLIAGGMPPNDGGTTSKGGICNESQCDDITGLNPRPQRSRR